MLKHRMVTIELVVFGLLGSGMASAGETVVISAKAISTNSGWRFDVTLQHDDTGWEHYADAWRVVGEDGTVFGTRTLYHPHVDEQPFTRSLTGIAIPAGVSKVIIEGRDNIHGWGGRTIEVVLDR